MHVSTEQTATNHELEKGQVWEEGKKNAIKSLQTVRMIRVAGLDGLFCFHYMSRGAQSRRPGTRKVGDQKENS